MKQFLTEKDEFVAMFAFYSLILLILVAYLANVNAPLFITRHI